VLEAGPGKTKNKRQQRLEGGEKKLLKKSLVQLREKALRGGSNQAKDKEG